MVECKIQMPSMFLLNRELFNELKKSLDDQLTSKREIMQRMNIGEERFRSWIEMGAPISCEKIGSKWRFSADRKRLQDWCVQQFSWRKVTSQKSCQVSPSVTEKRPATL